MLRRMKQKLVSVSDWLAQETTEASVPSRTEPDREAGGVAQGHGEGQASTMTGVVALSESWSKALVTVVAVALSAKILVGSSARWRPAFVSGALVALVTCEYYYLFFAVMKVPRDWPATRGVLMLRWDCLQSTKGGKRAHSSASAAFDINPCFCPSSAYCRNMTADVWIYDAECPEDGTARCWDVNRRYIPLHIDERRDCQAAQGTRCTKTEPCTPCAQNSLREFISANTTGASRCRACGAGNRGECNFVIDEGPYCWKEPGSREIEPCSICCTEPQARSTDSVDRLIFPGRVMVRINGGHTVTAWGSDGDGGSESTITHNKPTSQ
eukprot:jgi/Undpi1/12170/HiC_scaffold_5.g01846.m1